MLDLIPAGRPVSIEREIFPQLVERGGRLRRRAARLLARHRHARGLPAGAPRRARAELRHRARRAARLRVHARRRRRRDDGRAARPAGVRRPGRADRRGSPNRQPGGDRRERGRRRGCVGRVVGDRSRRGRRGTHARLRLDSRRAGRARRRVRGARALRRSALARGSATGICSTTACGWRRTRRLLRARSPSREPRLAEPELARPLGLRRSRRSRSPGGTS